MTAGVYLLHFTSAYKHARHYIGYSDNVEERIAEHLAGRGARLPQVVAGAGIRIISARIWPDKDRRFERQLKNRHNSASLCPICNPASAMRRGTYHRNASCHAIRDKDADNL